MNFGLQGRVSLKLQSQSYILPLLTNYGTIYGDHISRVSDFYFNIWKIAIIFSFYNISSHNRKSWKNEKCHNFLTSNARHLIFFTGKLDFLCCFHGYPTWPYLWPYWWCPFLTKWPFLTIFTYIDTCNMTISMVMWGIHGNSTRKLAYQWNN